jgi:two-component system, NtrC family, response regulator HupR/HoxA
MQVCIVDDILENAKYVRRVLKDYPVSLFSDARQALEHCSRNDIDILITDQKMPGMTGIEMVQTLRARKTDFLTIVISAYTDSEDLIEAVNSNVIYKYIVKPFTPTVLLQHVQRAAEHLSLMRRNDELQAALRDSQPSLAQESQAEAGTPPSIFDVLVGADPAMKRIGELARSYALTHEPVLITGEAGTGKELLARVIHALSPRSERAFLVCNCAAFQERILESELFGYEPGAFTGVDAGKRGLLDAADGGVLLLDEIGELTEGVQEQLLRLLQHKSFASLGGKSERSVDVRFLLSSNRNLRALVDEGSFRSGLYNLLDTRHLHLPPLRSRPGDIPLIMERLAARRGPAPVLSEEARRVLVGHDFPGNVRELKSVAKRISQAVAHGAERPLSADVVRTALSSELQDDEPWITADETETLGGKDVPSERVAPGEMIDLGARLDRYRESLIRCVFEQEGGNITRTARRLAMSRQGLKNRLRDYGLLTSEGGNNEGRE